MTQMSGSPLELCFVLADRILLEGQKWGMYQTRKKKKIYEKQKGIMLWQFLASSLAVTARSLGDLIDYWVWVAKMKIVSSRFCPHYISEVKQVLVCSSKEELQL